MVCSNVLSVFQMTSLPVLLMTTLMALLPLNASVVISRKSSITGGHLQLSDSRDVEEVLGESPYTLSSAADSREDSPQPVFLAQSVKTDDVVRSHDKTSLERHRSPSLVPSKRSRLEKLMSALKLTVARHESGSAGIAKRGRTSFCHLLGFPMSTGCPEHRYVQTTLAPAQRKEMPSLYLIGGIGR